MHTTHTCMYGLYAELLFLSFVQKIATSNFKKFEETPISSATVHPKSHKYIIVRIVNI